MLECLGELYHGLVTVEDVAASVRLGIGFYLEERVLEEFEELLVVHLVVHDAVLCISPGSFVVHVVRWVSEYHVGQVSVHEPGQVFVLG